MAEVEESLRVVHQERNLELMDMEFRRKFEPKLNTF